MIIALNSVAIDAFDCLICSHLISIQPMFPLVCRTFGRCNSFIESNGGVVKEQTFSFI